jgi:hypothetical protein
LCAAPVAAHVLEAHDSTIHLADNGDDVVAGEVRCHDP